ncbi:hypothetical protein RQP46_004323 [Phenoliferia psychrophenolica]
MRVATFFLVLLPALATASSLFRRQSDSDVPAACATSCNATEAAIDTCGDLSDSAYLGCVCADKSTFDACFTCVIQSESGDDAAADQADLDNYNGNCSALASSSSGATAIETISDI